MKINSNSSSEMRDLYYWINYSSRFISFVDETTRVDSSLVEKFCEKEGIPDPSQFFVINQGSIIMMLYGLFVAPKELWRNALGDTDSEKVLADKVLFEGFKFHSRSSFIEDINTESLDKDVFLRRFRNSLAHSNFEVNKVEGTFRFRNIDKHNNNECNFDVQNNPAGLGRFVDEVGNYFLNIA